MAITINWGARIINVPQADLTNLGGGIYELDLDWFRLQLKDLEDSADGMAFPITHAHNTTVTLAGLTLARVIEIVNGYTVTFSAGSYAVNLVGANSNVSAVTNVNGVSVRSFNSAGLIVGGGSGLSAVQDALLVRIGDLLEADEEIRAATYRKKKKGPATVLLEKAVARSGNDIDLIQL
jgi:hypothetical protein